MPFRIKVWYLKVHFTKTMECPHYQTFGGSKKIDVFSRLRKCFKSPFNLVNHIYAHCYKKIVQFLSAISAEQYFSVEMATD